jgi:hypothetical protein
LVQIRLTEADAVWRRIINLLLERVPHSHLANAADQARLLAIACIRLVSLSLLFRP